MPAALHRLQLELGRALLAAHGAVAVVHDQHPRMAFLGHGAVKARRWP